MHQVTALLLSLAIEVPVALLASIVATRFVARVDVKWTLAAALLATLITHPCIWYLNQTFTLLAPWPRLLLLEAAVIIVEGAVYLGVARMPAPIAWATSLAANGASFLMGLALYAAGVIASR